MIQLLLFALPALAFRAPDDAPAGAEPTRIRQYHVERQTEARQSAAWTDFLRGEGSGWMARFDERTGAPHRAWGPGLDLGPVDTADQVEAGLRGFFARNPALLAGVALEDLRLEKAGYVARTDTWYVRLAQQVHPQARGAAALPVWRAGVEARIKQGRLILFGVDTQQGANTVDPVARLSVDQATRQAIRQGPAPEVEHAFLGRQLLILPVDDGNALAWRLCWEIRTATSAPLGRWVSFVDAHSGELLNYYNEIRFLTGNVTATHDTRTVNGDLSTSPVAYATVSSGSSTHTDVNGDYSLSGVSSATTVLSGSQVVVKNAARGGGEGSLDLSGDGTWTDKDATQAEIDSYIFLTQVRVWGDTYAPEVTAVSDFNRITSNVNLSSTCNAYFDGDVNFYAKGSGCNNTAQIADVNYHEWGHGFHYYNLESGSFDGSISEGIGDTVAFLNTGDPTIAPYFMTSGSGIREVATDHVYPDDWVGEVHEDGLIFAGAVWDLWDSLDAVYPGDPDTAYDVLNQLVVDGLKGGPEIPDSYDEFIAADDDDADLSNGTPHQCAILEAFALHGLGPGGGSTLVSLAHTPLENQRAGAGPFSLDAELLNLAPDCADFSVSEATVFYSLDGGDSWSEEPLSTDGEAIWGAIPEQPDGNIVSYYVTINADDGSEVSAPAGASINPFTFYVGDLTELYFQDFEDEDGDFTHELISGADELGADDWIWSRPTGAADDPDFAYSGKKVWGNDLGGGNYNGEYQDGKNNRLSSPSIDVSGYDRVILQYRRWLNVEDGYYDQASVLVNGERVWANHESSRSIGDEHHRDEQWALHTLEVPLDGSGQVVISWDLKSDEGLSFGGWNIDDVALYGVSATAPDTDDDSLGDGDDTGSPADLDGTDDTGSDGWFDDDDGGLTSDGKLSTCGGCATGDRRRGALAPVALLLAGLVARRRRD